MLKSTIRFVVISFIVSFYALAIPILPFYNWHSWETAVVISVYRLFLFGRKAIANSRMFQMCHFCLEHGRYVYLLFCRSSEGIPCYRPFLLWQGLVWLMEYLKGNLLHVTCSNILACRTRHIAFLVFFFCSLLVFVASWRSSQRHATPSNSIQCGTIMQTLSKYYAARCASGNKSGLLWLWMQNSDCFTQHYVLSESLCILSSCVGDVT